jgi:hypothetical protein
MRNHAMSRGRLLVVCVLGALASVVPTASADTTLPVWTCRASAVYAEADAILGAQRIEPVLANGFPNRDTPDAASCATQNTGVQNIDIPEGDAPLVSAEAASASTSITPEIAAARDQTVDSDAGIAETVHVNLGGLSIDAEAITAQAHGSCVNGQPVLTSDSTIVSLSIGDVPIEILDPKAPIDINLGLVRIRLNQTDTVVDPVTGDTKLTRRAAHIELLPLGGGQPLVRVVLGEAQVDFHGAVCAPEVIPTCPAGTVAQNPNARPLVCVLTVTQCAPGSAPGTTPNTCVLVCPAGSTADPGNGACVRQVQVAAPCPAGSTADPARGGACIVTVQAPPANCPSGTNRDPASNNCVLIRDRPCPEGSTPDPTTRVCVATKVNNIGSGENGRVGSTSGPVATCGRLDMHFVRGFKNLGRSFTSRFGNRTVTRGQLVTCGSNPKPIIGARVDVVHVLPGNKRRRKTGLRSRAAGKLTLILPIDLRTRNIEYAYRPDLRSTRVTSRITLHLTVKNKAGRTLR